VLCGSCSRREPRTVESWDVLGVGARADLRAPGFGLELSPRCRAPNSCWKAAGVDSRMVRSRNVIAPAGFGPAARGGARAGRFDCGGRPCGRIAGRGARRAARWLVGDHASTVPTDEAVVTGVDRAPRTAAFLADRHAEDAARGFSWARPLPPLWGLAL